MVHIVKLAVRPRW